jgi:hypothetical protein
MPYGAYAFLLVKLVTLAVLFLKTGFFKDFSLKISLSSGSTGATTVASTLVPVVASNRSHSDYFPIGGYDILALLHPRWPCHGTLQALTKLKNTPLALGILWGTFGDNILCLKKILSERNAPTLLRIHIANSVCVRRGNCSSNELLHQYSAKSLLVAMKTNDQKLKQLISSQLFQVSQVLNNLIKEYPQANLKCAISPLLEHPGDEKTTSFIYESISKQFLECDVVDNPEKPSHYSHDQLSMKNFFLEFHNKYAAERLSSKENDNYKCLASMDGEPAFIQSKDEWPEKETLSFIASGKKCLAYFLWHPAFNCLERFSDQKPPLARICSSDDEIKQIFESSPLLTGLSE